jgi:N utilization substance protein A
MGWKIDIKSEEEKRQEVEQQMSALVTNTSTPLENVTGLGEGLVEKLAAAGVTTVEALADMTPEQLEEIPGIGPKTIEKISLAVNEYFSNLESAESLPDTEVADEIAEEAAADGAGAVEADVQGSGEEGQEYKEDEETGQAIEAETIAGVENAPNADTAEVHVHGEEPEPAPEDTVEPKE